MHLSATVSVEIPSSGRTHQLEALFDVPRAARQTLSWEADLPIEDRDWSVGLIVGPSGAGKSTAARELFGLPEPFEWDGRPVIDNFRADLSMETISSVCQAVGFNTIPAWMRPYGVLSTGEQFRVTLARTLAESEPQGLLVLDEFTSVIDRQVAKIGSHAAQKWVRKNGRQFVAVTCHYDVLDWLQPDWVFQPATLDFAWRSVQPRPKLEVAIEPVDFSAWALFAPFHYLTAELNKSARCFVLFVEDEPAAFAGVLHRPHAKAKNIKGLSRLVTLPDWQGLGLAFVLTDRLAGAYSSAGFRFRTYPAHPALIHAFDRSPVYRLEQRPGTATSGRVRSGRDAGGRRLGNDWRQGSRPCAVFEYAGPSDDEACSALIR